MTVGDARVAMVSSVVVVAAILGGAFFPGPRVVVGSLLAIVLGWAIGVMPGKVAAEEWLVLAFIASGVVSTAVAWAAPLAAREVIAVWIVACSLWLVARRAAHSGSQSGALVVAAGAVIVALGVMAEAAGMGAIRVGGLLENPNVSASLLIASLPTLVIVPGRRGWRLAAVAAIVLGLVLTGSRAGLLALLAAVAIVLPRGRPRTLGLAIGGFGVVTILIWRFVSQPDTLAWFRPAIWAAVLRLWVAHPLFGVGPGGLVDAAGVERLLHVDHIGQRQFVISYAESTPLALLVQTGVLGFMIAGAAVAVWWRRAAHGKRLSAPLVATLLVMAVMAAFHDLLTVDIVLWWWALSVGLIEARTTSPRSDEDPPIRVASTRPLATLLFAFVVLWGVVQPAWARWLWRSGASDQVAVERATRAEPWFDVPLEWRVRDLLKRQSWTWEIAAEAISRGRRAARIHPGAAGTWSILGMVHARVVTDLGPWPDSVEGARDAFTRAVELEPHQPWAWLEWARLERNLGHTDDAVSLVRKALQAEPHAVRARLFLARLELDRGDHGAAREAFTRARESAGLWKRRGLSVYERELLAAPGWQFREIEEALR